MINKKNNITLLKKEYYLTVFLINILFTFLVLNIFHIINRLLLWIVIFYLYKSNNNNYKKYLKTFIYVFL